MCSHRRAPSFPALAAVAAHDVRFAGDELPDAPERHTLADFHDRSAEFVPGTIRGLHARRRPGIPTVDMQVRSTDGAGLDPHLHVPRANLRLGRVDDLDSRLRPHLRDRLHEKRVPDAGGRSPQATRRASSASRPGGALPPIPPAREAGCRRGTEATDAPGVGGIVADDERTETTPNGVRRTRPRATGFEPGMNDHRLSAAAYSNAFRSMAAPVENGSRGAAIDSLVACPGRDRASSPLGNISGRGVQAEGTPRRRQITAGRPAGDGPEAQPHPFGGHLLGEVEDAPFRPAGSRQRRAAAPAPSLPPAREPGVRPRPASGANVGDSLRRPPSGTVRVRDDVLRPSEKPRLLQGQASAHSPAWRSASPTRPSSTSARRAVRLDRRPAAAANGKRPRRPPKVKRRQHYA